MGAGVEQRLAILFLFAQRYLPDPQYARLRPVACSKGLIQANAGV